MPKVVSVKLFQVTTQLPADFVVASTGISRHREHLICELESEDGVVGLGEACPLPTFTGETLSEVETIIRKHFAELLIGTDVYRLPRRLEEIKRKYPYHPAAYAAIDLAYYDLVGKITRLPVTDLLGGGCRERVPLYKAVGIGSIAEMRREARELVESGFRCIKIKVEGNATLDCQRVLAIRQEVGDAARLIVDGNEGYSVGDAIRVGRFLAEAGVAYFEQPVHRDNLEGLRMVRNAAGIPLMADESLCTLRDAVRLAETRSVDLFGVKLVKCGGIGPAKQIIEVANQYAIPVVLISPFETAIGVAAALQLAATLPDPIEPQGLGTSVVMTGDPFAGLQWERGEMLVPQGPGLGVRMK